MAIYILFFCRIKVSSTVIGKSDNTLKRQGKIAIAGIETNIILTVGEQWNPGDTVVWNNRRMLHFRPEYTADPNAKRSHILAYANYIDFISLSRAARKAEGIRHKGA